MGTGGAPVRTEATRPGEAGLPTRGKAGASQAPVLTWGGTGASRALGRPVLTWGTAEVRLPVLVVARTHPGSCPTGRPAGKPSFHGPLTGTHFQPCVWFFWSIAHSPSSK